MRVVPWQNWQGFLPEPLHAEQGTILPRRLFAGSCSGASSASCDGLDDGAGDLGAPKPLAGCAGRPKPRARCTETPRRKGKERVEGREAAKGDMVTGEREDERRSVSVGDGWGWWWWCLSSTRSR